MLDDPTTRRPVAGFNWRAALDLVATIALTVAACAIIWTMLSRPSAPASASPIIPVPTAPLNLDGLPTLGSPEAGAVMLVFSDFECPYCAQFAAETMPALKRQYVDTGKVRVAFLHNPLPIHSRASRVAESAECASRQGRFWAMHDSLFQPPMRFAESDLEAHAREAQLDLVAFATCMAGEAVDRVAVDSALARELGLTGTPSFVIGVVNEDGSVRAVEVMTGARPLNHFADALERALAKPPTGL